MSYAPAETISKAEFKEAIAHLEHLLFNLPSLLFKDENEVATVSEMLKCSFGWQARTTGDGIVGILKRGPAISAVHQVLSTFCGKYPENIGKWVLDIILGAEKVYAKFSVTVTPPQIGVIAGEEQQITPPAIGALSSVPYADPYYTESHRRFRTAVHKFMEEVIMPDATLREEDSKRLSQAVFDVMVSQKPRSSQNDTKAAGPGGFLIPRTVGIVMFLLFILVDDSWDAVVISMVLLIGAGGETYISLPPILNFSQPAFIMAPLLKQRDITVAQRDLYFSQRILYGYFDPDTLFPDLWNELKVCPESAAPTSSPTAPCTPPMTSLPAPRIALAPSHSGIRLSPPPAPTVFPQEVTSAAPPRSDISPVSSPTLSMSPLLTLDIPSSPEPQEAHSESGNTDDLCMDFTANEDFKVSPSDGESSEDIIEFDKCGPDFVEYQYKGSPVDSWEEFIFRVDDADHTFDMGKFSFPSDVQVPEFVESSHYMQSIAIFDPMPTR
ncbi:hypothetical protein B0H14DRAFT_3888682 [Mycena olivaceomarginata]|nr:hypothetical protein B0H14DRAFT_3888682 [Mycena olivaceomarginata]